MTGSENFLQKKKLSLFPFTTIGSWVEKKYTMLKSQNTQRMLFVGFKSLRFVSRRADGSNWLLYRLYQVLLELC